MRLIVLFMFMLIASPTAIAQTEDFQIPLFPSSQHQFDRMGRAVQKQHSNANQNFTKGHFNITIPGGLSSEKMKETHELIKKLQEVCPQCSTGGTIGGGVITGGNTQGVSPTLTTDENLFFSTEYIYVQKSTYEELKRKAATCDELRTKEK